MLGSFVTANYDNVVIPLNKRSTLSFPKLDRQAK